MKPSPCPAGANIKNKPLSSLMSSMFWSSATLVSPKYLPHKLPIGTLFLSRLFKTLNFYSYGLPFTLRNRTRDVPSFGSYIKPFTQK